MVDFEAISKLCESLRRKRRAQEDLREKATDTSVKLTDMPRSGGDGKQAERIMISICAMEEECNEIEAELNRRKEQLRREMKKLTKQQHQEAIRKRYLEGEPVFVVSQEMGYEYRSVTRFINEAKEIINGQ